VTLVVGGVALVALLLLSRLGAGIVTWSLLGAADAELGADAATAVTRLESGTPPLALGQPGLRVVDTAGLPVDGRPPLPLSADQIRALAAGEPVLSGPISALRRWLAQPAVLPDGTPRLVVASGDVVGGLTLIGRASIVFTLAALAVAAVIAAAAWAGTRAALRPVDRLRTAAAALPPGQRLPVPVPQDEIRALAVEFNALLARRDEAGERLERFTGDAAHELRSPLTAIRAQAEVAVAHPDPELVAETLESIAAEAARLSGLLSDLLALARADAGERPPAEAVDLVAAAGTALGRVPQTRDGPVVELAAPVPATVAATPSEVATVLDNLLGNALRHARSLVRVTVLPGGRTVRMLVEDDGPGIPEADRARVFDRFVRLDPTAGGGAGLGLALVAALVSGRGGTVTAGESRGGGARLDVRWPAP
jgi:two-component system, OmpR family, sensor kinase